MTGVYGWAGVHFYGIFWMTVWWMTVWTLFSLVSEAFPVFVLYFMVRCAVQTSFASV